MFLKIFIKLFTLFAIVNAVPYAQQQPQQHQELQQQQLHQPKNEISLQTKPNTNLVQPKPSNIESALNVDQTPAAASAPSITYMDKDGTTNVLENPAYNPDIYNSFIPQDAIQQYLSYFGGPAPYTAGILPPPTPMAVQTGYEGYIIPLQPQQSESSPAVWSFLKGIIPKVLFAWVFKFAAIAVSAVGLILFGGALTTAICALTPLCSISFTAALPTIGRSLSVGGDSTLDKVKRAAEFLQGAIEKYDQLQMNDRTSFVRKFGRRNSK